MLKTVHLYDKLKDQFGGPHRFDIECPGDAIRALVANFPKTFPEAFGEAEYTIIAGDFETGETVDFDRLGFEYGTDSIHILPVAHGAKSGSGKAIITAVLGIGLLATGFLGAAGVIGSTAAAGGEGAVLGLDFGAGIGFAGITYGNIALFGASLLLQGVSSLLTSQTDPQKVGPTTASYLLNGPTNNSEQGGAVGLCFGRFRVGSNMVSTSLHAVAISVGSQNYTTDVTDAKGNVVHPSAPPDLTKPGMTPPLVPEIQPLIAWMYPYPEWPGHGAVVSPTQAPGGTNPCAVGTGGTGCYVPPAGGCGGGCFSGGGD